MNRCTMFIMLIRTNIYLTERQRKALKDFKEIEGLSVAEHIRRAIDTYISEKEKALRESARVYL